MESMEKAELFESAPVGKTVVTLAVPTVLSSLVMVIYNLADTWFVGMLNNSVENAAVTLAAPVLLAFNAVNNLFGVGTSSMMSRALGKKDYAMVRGSSALGFYCALLCSMLFAVGCTVFHTPLLGMLGADGTTVAATGEYLKWTVTFGAVPAILNVVMAYLVRSEGEAFHASIGTMSGCVLNIILDPVFIFPQGLNMGAAGAGLATFLSNCAACGYFLLFLFIRRGKTYVCIHPGKITLERPVVSGIFSVGIPSAIQNLLNVTGMTVLNNFTAAFGTDAVAAMGIAQKVNMIPMYICHGMSQGLMPLFGYNYAAGNGKRMKSVFFFAVRISILFLLAGTLFYFLLAGKIIALFMDNQAVVAYGAAFLRRMCIGLMFLAIDFMAVAVFQSCGMGGRALAFALLRKLVLEIPALYILNWLFPLYGLACAQTVAEMILAAAAVLSLRQIFRRLDGK